MTEEVNRSGGVHLRLGRRQAPTLRGIYRDAKYGGKHQQGNFAGMGLPRLVTLTLILSRQGRGSLGNDNFLSRYCEAQSAEAIWMGLPRLVTLTFGLTLTLSSKWRGNYVKGEEI